MNFVEPIRDRKKIAQIKNLLRGRRRHRDLFLFVVGINTALRISDLLELRIEHFVNDQQRIRHRFWIKEKKRGKRQEQDYIDKVKAYHQTEAYQKAMRKRGVWVEPLFGEAKEFHRLRRFRLRGLKKVNVEGIMIAAGQNLKRLIKHRLGGLYSSMFELLFQPIFTGDSTFSTAWAVSREI